MENVIIIGGGPAGYTAAIYTGRANLKPIVFEGSKYGGQLMSTTEVENFPGFPEGVMGPELIEKIRAQGEKFSAKLVQEDVTKVDFSRKTSKGFVVWAGTNGTKKYEAKAVIIATGSEYRKLGLESEKRLSGKGVSYCATCDGFFFQGKDIIVVGGGDSAMEEATFLTKFANSVKIVYRGEKSALRASKAMLDKAFANKKISFVFNSEIIDVFGKNNVEGIKVKDNKTGKTSEIKCQGIFVAIGHIPNTALFEDQLKLEKGYIITVPGSAKTSVEGIFAAGDVMDWTYRQAITSAASGCKAAIEVERYLHRL